MQQKKYLHHALKVMLLSSERLTVSKVRNWVKAKRFCEEMSFTETASDIGVSPLSLKLYLRLVAHKGFPRWRRDLRIAEAAKLLSDPRESEPVYVICGLVGIPDVRSFRRQFASVTGMTPGEYRQMSLRQSRLSSQRSGQASEGMRKP